MISRRHFIKTAALGAASFAAAPSVLGDEGVRLVVLHTNDTHSRIDPFPLDGGRNQGLGGAARRATLIRQIRRRHPHVLLLDSGDIFQGTPYFNFFGGEIELKTMSAMAYDVATLGNHDFDNGVEGLAKVLPYASFEFVSANYDVSRTPLAARVKPYTIRTLGDVKVGLFGLGIDFDRLVPAPLHEGVTYSDPVRAAQQSVEALRNAGCHLVICLSHLGYRYRGDKISDTDLAQAVPGIDAVLGGHTHTFMDGPDVYEHAGHASTLVHQVGWAGIRLGRIDFVLTRTGQRQRWFSQAYELDARWDGV